MFGATLEHGEGEDGPEGRAENGAEGAGEWGCRLAPGRLEGKSPDGALLQSQQRREAGRAG